MSQQTIAITLNGKKCVLANPRKYPQAAGKANGYYCPRGHEPGRAFLLLLRRDLDSLGRNAAMTLRFTAGKTLTVGNLWFVKAHSVSGGPRGDKNRVYLVELVDRRGLMAMASGGGQYNIRSPAPPEDGSTEATTTALSFHTSSLDSSTTRCTWQDMLDFQWAFSGAPSLWGTSPTLPYTPHQTPDGWKLMGTSAWEGHRQICKKLAVTLAYDPIADAFELQALGDTQPGLSTAESKYRLKLDDAAPLTGTAATIPYIIQVFFHRRERHWGMSDTVWRENTFTQIIGHYASSVLTNVAGAIPGTHHIIWDDMPAIFDELSTVTFPENKSDLDARAAEVAANWLRARQASTDRAVYQGIAPEFTPGAEVAAVHWRNFGDGFVTEVLLSPPAESDPGWFDDLLRPPIIGRLTPMLHPHETYLVRVDSVTAAGGVFPGEVVYYHPSDLGTQENGFDCWIWFIDDPTVVPIANQLVIGRLIGVKDVSSDVRPLMAAVHLNACSSIWAAIPTGTPTTGDYVLGYRSGCLLRFPVGICEA